MDSNASHLQEPDHTQPSEEPTASPTPPYDVIVVGGGPAGAVASMYLKKAGKNVLLIDKAAFPRDKICGDAQGRKLAVIAQELGIYDDYTKLPGVPIYGLRLSSPDSSQIDLTMVPENGTPGYVVRRKDVDNFLFQKAKAMGVETREHVQVIDILQENSDITGLQCKDMKANKELVLTAHLYIGADGANSIFARKYNLKSPPEHLIVATRAYYTGVTDLSDKIEIHMVKDVLPGYFWIFPLPHGEANVGVGMVVQDKIEKATADETFKDMRRVHERVIQENKLISQRFEKAELLGHIDAWNLPVASHHRKPYGQRFMLVGDAASLINPLSGEGVGTACISGKHAAQVAVEALEKQDFSADFLKLYDKRLWDEIGTEMKSDYKIQKLGKKWPGLIDRVVHKAQKDEKFKKRLESMLPFVEGKQKLGTWRFILSLFL